VSAAPIVAAPTARLSERPGDGLGHNGGWAMSLRNEWKTVKADMDALAKTHKAAIERTDLKFVRSSKAFELGFGPLLDAYEKVAAKAEEARPNVSPEQKAALKAAGMKVLTAGAVYMKLLTQSRTEAERVKLPPPLIHGIGCMQSKVIHINISVNSAMERCGA
jgi:hypothetical protein